VTSTGRATLWIIAAVLLVFTLAIWAMLAALQGQIHPPCLDQVAEAPDGAFAQLSPEVGADGTRTVVYADGLQMVVPESPQRLVSTLPGLTEMIAYLGAEDRLVAVTKWCDHPASVTALPRISVLPFDAEGLLQAKPDLVILDRRLHRRDLALIRRRVGLILPLETSRSLPHLVRSMHILAAVLGGETAKAQAAVFEARYTALLAAIDTDWPDGPPRVLAVAQWDPLIALGPGSLLDDLLRTCGCLNIACDLGTDASGPFNEELVLARGPTWFLTPKEPVPERLRERWKNVPAMKDGRMAPAWTDDLARGGPRILDALERLYAVLRGDWLPAHLGESK
jgi:iron complex transport system substrate-binding protein